MVWLVESRDSMRPMARSLMVGKMEVRWRGQSHVSGGLVNWLTRRP
jgi:hypothetical protein